MKQLDTHWRDARVDIDPPPRGDMNQMTFTTQCPAAQGTDLPRTWASSCWLLTTLAMMLAETTSNVLASVMPRGSQGALLIEGGVVAALILKPWGRRPSVRAYWSRSAVLSTAIFVLAKQMQEMTRSGPDAVMATMIAAIAGLILFRRIAGRHPNAVQEKEEGLRCIASAICGAFASSTIRWLADDQGYAPFDLAAIVAFADAAMLIVYMGTKVSLQKLFWPMLFSSCALGVLAGRVIDHLAEVDGRIATCLPALSALALFMATLVAKRLLHAIHLRTLGIER